MEEILRRIEALEEAEGGLRRATRALSALGLDGYGRDVDALLEEVRARLSCQEEFARDQQAWEAAREWETYWDTIP